MVDKLNLYFFIHYIAINIKAKYFVYLDLKVERKTPRKHIKHIHYYNKNTGNFYDY